MPNTRFRPPKPPGGALDDPIDPTTGPTPNYDAPPPAGWADKKPEYGSGFGQMGSGGAINNFVTDPTDPRDQGTPFDPNNPKMQAGAFGLPAGGTPNMAADLGRGVIGVDGNTGSGFEEADPGALSGPVEPQEPDDPGALSGPVEPQTPNAYYAPTTWQGNINQQTATDWINNYARGRQGQNASPEQLAAIQAYAQSQGWQPGQDLTPADWNRLVDWMDSQPAMGEPGGAAPVTPPGTPSPTPETPAPTTPTPTPTTPADPTPASIDADLLKRLHELLGTDVGNVDPNSQALNAQRNAFLRARNTGLERSRNALAERGAATGTLTSGGFDADLNQLYEQAAGDESDFEAGLIGDEIKGQRDRLMQAMNLAAQLGEGDKARQLQLKIAQMDEALRKQGMTLQEKLGSGDLNLRKLLGLGNLGLGAKQLEQSGSQFKDRLGFDFWKTIGEWSNQDLDTLLNSL